MARWSWLKGLLGRRDAGSPVDDPFSEVHWIPAGDSPFGVEVLDCRSLALKTFSVAQDQKIAERYTHLRFSTGVEYRGRTPEDSKTCACDLRYALKEQPRDGPVFKSEVMEDKWDIYLYEGHLYFTRSWTADLAYKAAIAFRNDEVNVLSVEARGDLVEGDPSYSVAVVDYLIRSHLYGLPVPHPLPKSVRQEDARWLATYSVVHYGRHALYGTFADTLHLPALTPPGSGSCR
jgi:hypothetical protein